jgi:hypothetical protein
MMKRILGCFIAARPMLESYAIVREPMINPARLMGKPHENACVG